MGHRGWALGFAVACLLVLAEQAHAGTISRNGSGVIVYTANPGEANKIDVFQSGFNYYINDVGNTETDAGSGCIEYDVSFWFCGGTGTVYPPPTGYRLVLGDGNDQVLPVQYCCEPPDIPITVDAGGGNDTITGGLVNDVFDGGAGSDTFHGSSGAADTVTYASRTNGVTVDLATAGNDDGSQDDGNPGAGDNIGADIEKLMGSNGPDTLTAAGAAPPGRSKGSRAPTT